MYKIDELPMLFHVLAASHRAKEYADDRQSIGSSGFMSTKEI